MNYRQAFDLLRDKVRNIQNMDRSRMTPYERDQEDALLIALNAMRDWSGSFHPDEMLVCEEIPALRVEVEMAGTVIRKPPRTRSASTRCSTPPPGRGSK